MNKEQRAALKARVAEKQVAVPINQSVAEPVRPSPNPTKEKGQASPTLTHICGHVRNVKDITQAPCPACRHKARLAKTQKRNEQRTKMREQTIQKDMRLPNGSRFSVTYDARTQTWSGALGVPLANAPTDFNVFEGSASGVFKLLKLLDGKFRETLVAALPAVPPSG